MKQKSSFQHVANLTAKPSEPILHGRHLHVPPASVTEGRFSDWIASAPVGEAILYHEGLLLQDRSESGSRYPARERARIHAVARRAWIACELGLIHLFSQRVAENHYRYLAIRSATTLRPPEIRNQLRTTQPASRNPH